MKTLSVICLSLVISSFVAVPSKAAPEKHVSSVDPKDGKVFFDVSSLKEAANAKIEQEELTEEKVPPKVEIIIDSSGSMGQVLSENKTKMYYLKKIVGNYMKDQWKKKGNFGMRVYGAKDRKSCDDTEITIPFNSANLGKIEKAVENLSPLGMTPLHKSLLSSFDDLKSYQGPKRVVIVTDGEDTCGGDPCKTSEELRKKALDIKFYVVALGFKGQSDALKKIKCIGDTHMADDQQQFQDAMSQVSAKLGSKDNLQVISPNPDSTVYLYKVEDGKTNLVRTFYASSSVQVPPGDYEAVVGLTPLYKFGTFTIPPKKKVTLKVEGSGEVVVNFFNSILNVEVLDKNMKAVAKFKSDQPTRVPAGKWKLHVYKDPFYDYLIETFYVYPDGKHPIDVNGLGVVRVDASSLRGVYIYDQESNQLGQYLSGFPLVLRAGVYTVHVNDTCSFPKTIVRERKEILVLNCPDAK